MIILYIRNGKQQGSADEVGVATRGVPARVFRAVPSRYYIGEDFTHRGPNLFLKKRVGAGVDGTYSRVKVDIWPGQHEKTTLKNLAGGSHKIGKITTTCAPRS